MSDFTPERLRELADISERNVRFPRSQTVPAFICKSHLEEAYALRAGADAMDRVAELEEVENKPYHGMAEVLSKRPEESPTKCSICGSDHVIAFVRLTSGCYCRPNDKWQLLCHQHFEESSPCGFGDYVEFGRLK